MVMKKNIYLSSLILLCLCFQKLNAQTIPNGSFEEWSGGMPVGWYGDSGYVSQSANAWNGQYAAELVFDDEAGFYANTSLATGNVNGPDYATTGRPDSLYFWYIFYSVNDDYFEVQTAGLNDSTGLTATSTPFVVQNTSNSVYKLGVIGYQYNKPSGNLDTMSITISIITANPYNDEGSYLIVDAFSFNSAETAVTDQLGNGVVAIEKIQPNPANDKTEIIYSLPALANVTLDLFDLEGRKLQTVVNDRQTPGTYRAMVNTASLPTGNYYCRLNADGTVVTEKIMVIR